MPLDPNDIALIREAIANETTAAFEKQLAPVHDKLDGLAKSVADLRGEQFAHQATHDRHERWIQRLAGKIGLKLSA